MKSSRESFFIVFLLVAQFSIVLFKGFPFYALEILYAILCMFIVMENLRSCNTRTWVWISIGSILGIVIGVYAFMHDLFVTGIAIVICDVAIITRSIWEYLHLKK